LSCLQGSQVVIRPVGGRVAGRFFSWWLFRPIVLIMPVASVVLVAAAAHDEC